MNKQHRSLLILGAGGHAKVVADCALSSGWDSVAFLDDRFPTLAMVGQWPVIGRIDWNLPEIHSYTALALGVGSNALRLQWLCEGLECGFSFPAIIHSRAVVSPHALVGDGSVVFASAVINIDAAVARACIVNTGAVVEHDCIVADACHISPLACLAGGVSLGKFVWVEVGACVLPTLHLADRAIVGAGAVVVNNVNSGNTVVGVPAKIKKS